MAEASEKTEVRVDLDAALLRRLGVRLVILFGSAVTGDRHPLSDTDIGLVFERGRRPARPALVYGELLAEFKKHFPEPLDLVYLDEGSPGLRFRAVTEGRPLYESRFGDFADYRAEAMLRYFDFRHYEDIFHASVLGLAA